MNLKGIECNEGSYTKKYQDHILCSFVYKVVCIDDINTKPIIVYRGENAPYEFIKAILKEYYKKIMNKYFNKNLIMSEEEKLLFQKSNSCWICKKLIDNDEEKVRDHCHVTGRFRGSAHESCKLRVDSHLIFNELDKFDVKIKVIPNGLEKYMAFFL